jgi:hypothetical protein
LILLKFLSLHFCNFYSSWDREPDTINTLSTISIYTYEDSLSLSLFPTWNVPRKLTIAPQMNEWIISNGMIIFLVFCLLFGFLSLSAT